jgi:hypothetical protein
VSRRIFSEGRNFSSIERRKALLFRQIGVALGLPLQASRLEASSMTLRIEKHSEQCTTTIRLIGRMRAEHLAELEQQIRDSDPKVLLDMEELNLVDVEVVRYLGSCELQGIALMNCSAYIRDWIAKERD